VCVGDRGVDVDLVGFKHGLSHRNWGSASTKHSAASDPRHRRFVAVRRSSHSVKPQGDCSVDSRRDPWRDDIHLVFCPTTKSCCSSNLPSTSGCNNSDVPHCVVSHKAGGSAKQAF